MPQPRPITRRPAIISGRATKPPQAGTVADLHPFTASAAPDDVVQDLSTGDGVEDEALAPPSLRPLGAAVDPRGAGGPARRPHPRCRDRSVPGRRLRRHQHRGSRAARQDFQAHVLSPFPLQGGAVRRRRCTGSSKGSGRRPMCRSLRERPRRVLHRLARLGVHASVAPMTLALSRLMLVRDTTLPRACRDRRARRQPDEAVRQIAAMLERASRAGRVAIDRPEFAAEQFLALLTTVPQRRALGLGAR